jgi:hypothetical protein
VSESERGYGGQAAIDRMKMRLGASKVFIDDVEVGETDGVDIYSPITHYVGDDCQPDGHRSDTVLRVDGQ